MLNKFIRNFIAKKVAGRTDDGIMIKLSDPKKVEFQTAMLEDLLMRNGIDPRAITSEEQLKMLLNQIDAINKQTTTTSGIRNTESAKVFDLEGKEIPKGSQIMGGKAVDDLPPPGSRGGPDDIAAPVQSQEETMKNMMEAEIKAKLEKQNKDSVQKILDRKNREDVYGLDDYDTTNMSDIKKEIIRTETKLGNLNPDDPNFREKAKPLVDKIETLKNKMREDKASGGRIGLKIGTGLRFLQKIFGKEKFKEMATRDPEMYQGMLEVVDMYRKRDKEGLKMYLQKFLPHMDDAQIEDFIRGSDGSEGLVGELIRLGSGRDYAGKLEMIKRSEEMKKLRDLEVTDDMIRKPNADGGIMRLGFKDGMNRRTFLKILGGAMSIPIIGKIFKPFKIGKTVTKVPIIKTDNVAGKPEWFDQLINKVILEGDEVTKKFATKDREIVHMKVLEEGTGGKEFPPGTPGSDDTSIIVTQDLDAGAVRVEYRNPENMYGDPVSLQYKKPLPDEGAPNPAAEFDTAESIPVARADGPDDYAIDIDEGGGQSIKDLTSDVSKLKEYATGQKPTLKEFVQSKKRKDKARKITEGEGEAEQDFIINRQGEPIIDMEPDIDDQFASGGIARMLGE
jgi:hypothetical protein